MIADNPELADRIVITIKSKQIKQGKAKGE
jgi:hypothetical protein